MARLTCRLAAMLIVVLLAGSGASCGAAFAGPGDASGSVPDGAAGSRNASSDPVRISVMVFDRGNAPEGQGTPIDNRWTAWINEQMGRQRITVDFMAVARSEESTKIPVMMATKTAADVMMSYNYAMVRKFHDDGMLHELDALLEQHGANVRSYIGDACIDVGRDEYGTLFAIAARRSTTAASNLFIRKDWLDALGIAVPSTIDELYNALRLFKEEDPGGVGAGRVIASAIPVGSRVVAKSFLTNMNETEYLIRSVGELSGHCYADRSGGLAYFKFRNRLYNGGLADREFFLSKNFSQKERGFALTGVLGFWEYDVNGNVDTLRGGILQTLQQQVHDAELISIPPMRNIWDDRFYNPSYPVSGAFLFMPVTAKSPEAVMSYLDFLAGEGGFTIFHGFEGEHFEFEDNIPVVIDAVRNAQTKDWIRHDLFLVGNQGYYKIEEDFFAATAKELPGWEDYVLENYSNATIGIRIPMTTYASPTQAREAANIQKLFDDYAVQMITGAPDQVEKLYTEMLAEFGRYGMEDILSERRAYYEKMAGAVSR